MGEALVGCPFPDFSMEIVGNHPSQGNGEHMRLTDLTSNGRPTLLQFYACKRRTLLHDATVSKRRIFTHGPVLVPNPCHTMCYPTRAGSTGPPPAPHMYSASDASSSTGYVKAALPPLQLF